MRVITDLSQPLKVFPVKTFGAHLCQLLNYTFQKVKKNVGKKSQLLPDYWTFSNEENNRTACTLHMIRTKQSGWIVIQLFSQVSKERAKRPLASLLLIILIAYWLCKSEFIMKAPLFHARTKSVKIMISWCCCLTWIFK